MSFTLMWALIAFIAAIVLLFANTYMGLLAFLLARPIIEMAWDLTIVGPFTMLHITGIVPIAIAGLLSFQGRLNLQLLRRNPIYLALIIFIAYALLQIAHLAINDLMLKGIDRLLRTSNALAGMILFVSLISNSMRYKKFLLVTVLLSIVPLVILYLQIFGMVDLRSQGYIGQTRFSGLFNGPVNQRHFFSFAILAILAHYKMVGKMSLRGLVLLSLLGIGLLFGYSKAATLFIITLPFLYISVRPKFVSMIPVLIIAVALLSYLSSSGYMDAIFLKEIQILSDDSSNTRAFQGRTYVWELFWERFNNEPPFNQLIGAISADKIGIGGGIHNDYLLNLNRYGYIGLLLYILVVVSMVKLAFIDTLTWGGVSTKLDGLIFFSRGLMTIWLLDAMGLHNSMYPSLLLYTFGVLAITHKEMLIEKKLRRHMS